MDDWSLHADHLPNRPTSGAASPIMEPVSIPQDAACRCFPRNSACITTYARIAASFILLIIGVVGVFAAIGGYAEDKCILDKFWSLITAVLGYWIGAATSLALNETAQQGFSSPPGTPPTPRRQSDDNNV